MKKLALAALVIAFAGACAHKSKTETPPAPSAATTKDQAPSEKTKKSKTSTASTASSVKCTRDKDERTIEINDKDGGCETIYTKMGEAKSIATAAHGSQHCQDVSEKIQKNLANAGFTCQ